MRPVLLGGALLCAGLLVLAACGEDDEPADFNTDAALSVADAYFEAYNAGDVDAVMALLTPDVAIDWFGSDFTHVGDPLRQWIVENRPEDVEAASPGSWTTVEAARQTGELQAQLAQEWAAYLEEKGCTYLDGC